jgi:peptidoglycan/LPS O-acetylase OafA/YrhL
MAACIFLRGINWYNHGQADITAADYWQHIYYSSFTRFDELLPGIAIALLKNFHTQTFAKLVQKGNLLLILGSICTAAMFYILATYFYIDGYGFSFLIACVGYTFLSISFAILTMAALSSGSLLYRIKIPYASQLALWSYAIYLIHRPLFTFLVKLLNQYYINIKTAFGTSIIMSVSIFCGWLLYRVIEIPIMQLRDKYYPTNIIASNSDLNKIAPTTV